MRRRTDDKTSKLRLVLGRQAGKAGVCRDGLPAGIEQYCSHAAAQGNQVLASALAQDPSHDLVDGLVSKAAKVVE